MAAWRRAIELSLEDADLKKLMSIAQSRGRRTWSRSGLNSKNPVDGACRRSDSAAHDGTDRAGCLTTCLSRRCFLPEHFQNVIKG
jgi:hypothetical protein